MYAQAMRAKARTDTPSVSDSSSPGGTPDNAPIRPLQPAYIPLQPQRDGTNASLDAASSPDAAHEQYDDAQSKKMVADSGYVSQDFMDSLSMESPVL